MATYSLLQVSLDQTIDRATLEEASDVVKSVARADCAHMQRDLFGIVVSNLPLDEAQAFQAELKRRGFPTDVVADDELPALHEPFTIQRIDINKDSLVFTDTMGKAKTRAIPDLVFVAGGFLTRSKMKSVLVMESDSARGPQARQPVLEQQHRFEDVPEFRLDFFFWSAPNRLRASVSSESVMFFRGRPMRLRDTVLLRGAMMDLQELLPPERVGAGLKRSDTKNFYPSLHSYEEEIRWHFHRLKPPA